ncbi:hypothetical protein ACLMAL_19415 [Nocardia sp. CWNU-33]|uniref:hypothetical protein n=1 Tax=Nocardia sp. CWNU-33 TaxID=3392117 RepID=UPI00398E7BFA
MADEVFEVVPVAYVVGGRHEPTDDHWGGAEAIIRIDNSRFSEESVQGLDAFSHLEIVFRFHLTDQTDLHFGAQRPQQPRMAEGRHLWT